MTTYQRKVLLAVNDCEYSGFMETASRLYGHPTHLEAHNLGRALDALHDNGYIEIDEFVMTDKGRAAIAATEAR